MGLIPVFPLPFPFLPYHFPSPLAGSPAQPSSGKQSHSLAAKPRKIRPASCQQAHQARRPLAITFHFISLQWRASIAHRHHLGVTRASGSTRKRLCSTRATVATDEGQLLRTKDGCYGRRTVATSVKSIQRILGRSTLRTVD